MLRKLLRKRLENSLRKVKKFESKGSVVKNESKELKNSGEDKDFYEAKKRIMEKYKDNCLIFNFLDRYKFILRISGISNNATNVPLLSIFYMI